MVEIAAGVPLAWARRDVWGAGAAGAAVSGVLVAPAGVPLLSSVSDVGSLEPVAVELVVPSALSVSLVAVSVCVCCAGVACGCMASAMAAIGIVALTMDVHAIAQSR